ncbi:hypothetical protein SUGI_1036740, partial [Cryptomeria japonica]
MERIVGMVRNGEGFVFPGGDWIRVSDFTPLRIFLLWSANFKKELYRASAQIGMNGVKDYLRSREVQSIRDELAKWGSH